MKYNGLFLKKKVTLKFRFCFFFFYINLFVFYLHNAQVQALRVILSNLQAKSKERQWVRHQTSGELDDMKLIEGEFLLNNFIVYRKILQKSVLIK